MLQKLHYHSSDFVKNPVFSILIPSWNNLKYLQLCVNSIRKNSSLQHQIIIILNQAIDGSLEWIKQQKDLDYVYAEENIGICYGLNSSRKIMQSNYILYANDDMYFLPHWDRFLKDEIDQIGHPLFMLSATMIEPHDTGNPAVILANYGLGLEDFREEELLQNHLSLQKEDWNGSTWPPNVVHRDLWDLVGGMSVEYHPGMYSDPDLSKKLYDAGVRYFKGLGKSRVYHFGSKSTARVKKNNGAHTFLLKWGLSSRDFTNGILVRGASFQILPTQTTKTSSGFIQKLKSIKSIWSRK